MKNKHIFWGILLISFGILILLNKLTSYQLYTDEVWKLWPAVLILWGLALILTQPLVRSILIGLTAFFLAFAVFSSIRSGFSIFDHDFIFDGDESEITINDEYEVNKFSEPFSNNIKKAILNFDAGAGVFIIKDTSDSLFQATAEGAGNNYFLERSDADGESTLDFMMKKKRFSFRHGHFKNKVIMNLNTAPVWDLNFNSGAADINLDLSKYKIGNINIEMGAASFKVVLGEPDRETHFKLSAGVSSVDVYVPENAGCEIRTDISLSSKNFEGFNKIEDDLYRTDNFKSSDKKIYIEFNTGVSSITVKRSSDWQ